MNPRKIAEAELRAAGFYLDRHGANHDVWRNDSLRVSLTLPRHNFGENTLRYIRKEIAGAQRDAAPNR